jgi:RNA polymerase sigma-70 factor (ECF subfamily)
MEMEATLTAITPGLLRLALGLTGNRHDAEDLVQEALASLVRFWRTKGPPESPAAFACTVVRRQARRSGERSRTLVALDEAGGKSDGNPQPDDSAHHALHLARALGALAGLEAGDREAILLVAAGGLKVEEAASVLAISVPAFKMRVSRARRRLAAAMETDDGQRTDEQRNAV